MPTSPLALPSIPTPRPPLRLVGWARGVAASARAPPSAGARGDVVRDGGVVKIVGATSRRSPRRQVLWHRDAVPGGPAAYRHGRGMPAHIPVPRRIAGGGALADQGPSRRWLWRSSRPHFHPHPPQAGEEVFVPTQDGPSGGRVGAAPSADSLSRLPPFPREQSSSSSLPLPPPLAGLRSMLPPSFAETFFVLSVA
ncbi:hypothetical protein PVAP13_2KG196900 [Panicum virgatum]|uniref:Uncharacterized protein n=1 Tax=Panicum virgatum TaxID=38727 RepID=A0A8T0W647_PANVG|nr:hypothetical protein PVAP13_2KG196900 [Panicum virgatum]